MTSPSYRLGVDVGGTFTDLLLLREDTGETWRAKVPSTPEDQSLAVIRGKDQIMTNIPNGADVTLNVVNHGTTVATNAILEQKGAKVALVVTEGYRDILQTRRSQVPGGLASWIIWPKPEPLAPLELTVEAPGRLGTDGNEVREFDEDVFAENFRPIVEQKPDAVTISLINSFANPVHEQTARRVVLKLLPDTPVSISSEVLPELMEYERTITTVVNSYVEPRVSLYLKNLLASLEEKAKHLRILRSDGGLSSVSLASHFPVSWVLSGPAGGVTGVVSVVANQTKFKNLITIDMGGTSTDVALIDDGVPRIRRETKIGDLVVRAPSVDVRTVGAGGGSIARVPEVTKALRVGPESAGAEPGPACYGKGGSAATVTDANAVLGYLPKSLLGGSFALDLRAAKGAVQRVADDLGIGLYEAAEGILKVSNETMSAAAPLPLD
jgi:5-oxoprolinase (ATP-hydrolysing)